MKRYQALRILFDPESYYARAVACTVPPKSTRDFLLWLALKWLIIMYNINYAQFVSMSMQLLWIHTSKVSYNVISWDLGKAHSATYVITITNKLLIRWNKFQYIITTVFIVPDLSPFLILERWCPKNEYKQYMYDVNINVFYSAIMKITSEIDEFIYWSKHGDGMIKMK